MDSIKRIYLIMALAVIFFIPIAALSNIDNQSSILQNRTLELEMLEDKSAPSLGEILLGSNTVREYADLDTLRAAIAINQLSREIAEIQDEDDADDEFEQEKIEDAEVILDNTRAARTDRELAQQIALNSLESIALAKFNVTTQLSDECLKSSICKNVKESDIYEQVFIHYPNKYSLEDQFPGSDSPRILVFDERIYFKYVPLWVEVNTNIPFELKQNISLSKSESCETFLNIGQEVNCTITVNPR